MSKYKLYIYRGLAMAMMLLLSLYVYPQEQVKGELHSTLYGVGTSNVLDTYLSPYNFTGVDARFIRETMRPTKLMSGHVYYQTFFDADASYLTSKTKLAHEYAGGLRYSNAWLYNILQVNNGKGHGGAAYIGLQPSVYVGGIYNTRNGNNPAQAKVDVMVNAKAVVQYDVCLFHKTFPVRYQLAVPLMGVVYSPNYGQSYYEEFVLKNYDHNVLFGNIVNMPSMRHLLTVDIPLNGVNSLRLGWSGEFNQAKLNGIRYHSYSNNFMIGYTKYFHTSTK